MINHNYTDLQTRYIPRSGIIVLDNYDSFTYNLAQYLGELGQEVRVHRNDEITTQEVGALRPTAVVISPGPGTPDQAGISPQVCRLAETGCPVLGVCLGMQSMAQEYGGKVIRAGKIMHGKVSSVHHREDPPLFVGLPNPFPAARYHSLIVQEEGLPDCFEIQARSEDPAQGDIMAIRHKSLPLMGIQFHPESVLTECGKMLLKNFVGSLARRQHD